MLLCVLALPKKAEAFVRPAAGAKRRVANSAKLNVGINITVELLMLRYSINFHFSFC